MALIKARVARNATKKNAKGKRWLKGQSSSSNPSTNKFREAAKKGFFQNVPGNNPALTTDALLKHNEQLQEEDELCIHSKALSISDELESTGVKTFATNWTACTNPSFESFLKNCKPNLAAHKDRLTILAAVTEVIRENKGKETATEYFAAMLTTLTALETTDHLSAGVALLSLVIKGVPASVLKAKFSEATKLFQELIGIHVEKGNPSLLRGLIGCLSVVLRVQDIGVWNHSSTTQTYLVLLSLSTHSKPRVRKAAQHAVEAVLKKSSFMNEQTKHPAASQTAKFCIHQLESAGTVASSTMLYILSLLRNILSEFSNHYVKLTCESVLRLMNINNAWITTRSFQTLYGLYKNRPPCENLSLDLNAQLINALYVYQPSPKDTRNQISWMNVLQEAHLNLLRLDEKLCLGHTSQFFAVLCRMLSSPKCKISSSIATTLKDLLYSFDQALLNKIKMEIQSNKCDMALSIQKMFASVESSLSYQCFEVWPSVFQVLAVFFEVFGKIGHSFMRKCLKSMAELHSSPNFSYSSDLEYVIGQAIKAIGPKIILECIPLNLDLDTPNLELSWLIPVLRDNIQETNLGFFKDYFMPLIDKFNNKVSELGIEGNVALKKTYEILLDQIWSLLPGFCTMPTDLLKSFKLLAKDFGKHLGGKYADYKLNILAAIRILIVKNVENEQNKTELARFAKNYLPILFNLYTKLPSSDENYNEGFRLAVFDTIKVYLEITDHQLCETLFKSGSQLLGSKDDSFSRNAILDLLRILLPYLKKDSIEKIYEIVTPLLNAADRTSQKKSYKLLEELCMGKSNICTEFINEKLQDLQKLLASSLSSTSVAAKAPRLRCLNHLVLQLNEDGVEFLLHILPEVISCCQDSAKKVKLASTILIINICEKYMKFGEKRHLGIQAYIDLLLAGMAGSTHFVCCTIVAVNHIISHYRDKISTALFRNMLEHLVVLGTVKTRTVISVLLDFLKSVITSLNEMKVASTISLIFEILSSLSKENRLHFRMKIRRILQRLLRKLGDEMMLKLTPAEYQKLLTYVRKQEIRDKKTKNKPEELPDDADDNVGFQLKSQSTIDQLLLDSSSDAEETLAATSGARNPTVSTCIQESTEAEIVDLLDPKVAKNIFATNPKNNTQKNLKSKSDFKIASDGRMIISEGDDNEKTNVFDNLQKRKRVESDDDDEMFAIDDEESSKFENDNRKRGTKTIAYGSEYKAKKAGGDVKRKGKPDPYAYVPLEIQSLNKRKKAKMSGKFKSVVRSARKGAQLGKQNRSKRKRVTF